MAHEWNREMKKLDRNSMYFIHEPPVKLSDMSKLRWVQLALFPFDLSRSTLFLEQQPAAQTCSFHRQAECNPDSAAATTRLCTTQFEYLIAIILAQLWLIYKANWQL